MLLDRSSASPVGGISPIMELVHDVHTTCKKGIIYVCPEQLQIFSLQVRPPAVL